MFGFNWKTNLYLIKYYTKKYEKCYTINKVRLSLKKVLIFANNLYINQFLFV